MLCGPTKLHTLVSIDPSLVRAGSRTICPDMPTHTAASRPSSTDFGFLHCYAAIHAQHLKPSIYNSLLNLLLSLSLSTEEAGWFHSSLSV